MRTVKPDIRVLYRDDHLIAVDKPPGLLVHRSPVDPSERLFALQLVRDMVGSYVYAVHRLDRPTSGVLLFAFTPEMGAAMSQIFRLGQARKEYLAVVRGHTETELVIDHPLPVIADIRVGIQESAYRQEAVTHLFRVATIVLPFRVDTYAQAWYSLVKLVPQTGRRHQLRRHLKHISHPIIGDAKYGKSKHNRFFEEQFGCSRLLLHASRLSFAHPVTAEQIAIESPLPSDFASLMKEFGWQHLSPDPEGTKPESHYVY